MWIAKWKWAALACVALTMGAGGILAAGRPEPSPAPEPRPAPRLVLVAAPAEPPKPPPEPKKAEFKRLWDVATEYLSAILNGKPELALKMGDKVTERHVKEIQTAGLTRVKFAMVLVNDSRALVVTAREKLKRRPGAEATDEHVTVTLERKDAAAPWLVRENDVADEKGVLRELDDYLEGKFDFKPDPLKASEPTKAKEPRPPWFVAEEFLTLALAGKAAEAVKLAVPGTVSEKKAGEIKEAGTVGTAPRVILLNDARTEVGFELRPLEEGVTKPMCLVLMLTRKGEDPWRVKDIDARDGKGIEARAGLYLSGAYDEKPAKP